MDALQQQLQKRWQEVLDDPDASAGNRRYAEWNLENLRRSEAGEPSLPLPEHLRDPDSPNWSSTLYLIEHPPEDLEQSMPLGEPGRYLVRLRLPPCRRCGHPQTRLSRRKALLPLRLLGFRHFRCLACRRRFRAWYPWTPLSPS
jgi:hypothetical protein